MSRKCFLGIFCHQVNSVHIQTFFLAVKYFLIVTLYFKVWENSKLEKKKTLGGGESNDQDVYGMGTDGLSNGMCDSSADQ